MTSPATSSGTPLPQPELLQEQTGDSAEAPRRGGNWFLHTLAETPATYLLIFINVAVYLVMLYAGVDRLKPSAEDLIRFGANNAEAVLLDHEWWRVITATFVHVGLLHLVTNMWCLWNLGGVCEPLIGFWGLCASYLITGVSGFLLSIACNTVLQQRGEVGAGASGAIFGITGLIIVFYGNRRLMEPVRDFPGIPLKELKTVRTIVIAFAVVSLLMGFATYSDALMRAIHLQDMHIDNAAHIGGLTSGMALAVPLLPRMTQGRDAYLARQKTVFAGSVLLLMLFAYWLMRLR